MLKLLFGVVLVSSLVNIQQVQANSRILLENRNFMIPYAQFIKMNSKAKGQYISAIRKFLIIEEKKSHLVVINNFLNSPLNSFSQFFVSQAKAQTPAPKAFCNVAGYLIDHCIYPDDLKLEAKNNCPGGGNDFVCNPAVFGVPKDFGNSGKYLCVPKSVTASLECNKQSPVDLFVKAHYDELTAEKKADWDNLNAKIKLYCARNPEIDKKKGGECEVLMGRLKSIQDANEKKTIEINEAKSEPYVMCRNVGGNKDYSVQRLGADPNYTYRVGQDYKGDIRPANCKNGWSSPCEVTGYGEVEATKEGDDVVFKYTHTETVDGQEVAKSYRTKVSRTPVEGSKDLWCSETDTTPAAVTPKNKCAGSPVCSWELGKRLCPVEDENKVNRYSVVTDGKGNVSLKDDNGNEVVNPDPGTEKILLDYALSLKKTALPKGKIFTDSIGGFPDSISGDVNTVQAIQTKFRKVLGQYSCPVGTKMVSLKSADGTLTWICGKTKNGVLDSFKEGPFIKVHFENNNEISYTEVGGMDKKGKPMETAIYRAGDTSPFIQLAGRKNTKKDETEHSGFWKNDYGLSYNATISLCPHDPVVSHEESNVHRYNVLVQSKGPGGKITYAICDSEREAGPYEPWKGLNIDSKSDKTVADFTGTLKDNSDSSCNEVRPCSFSLKGPKPQSRGNTSLCEPSYRHQNDSAIFDQVLPFNVPPGAIPSDTNLPASEEPRANFRREYKAPQINKTAH